MALNTGRNWVAADQRIYSFDLADSRPGDTDQRRVKNLQVFQFAGEGSRLESVIKVGEASWQESRIIFLVEAEQFVWINGIPQITKTPPLHEIAELYNPFKQVQRKPNHLQTGELIEFIKTSESESEKRTYSVALQKRYATPFLPLIITLFTAPFALSLNRKGNVTTVGYAVGIWLLFMGISNTFEQFGLGGSLDPATAVWSPLLIFGLVGSYLLTKVST
jgi:lipopolysaccharide export LptBFGC system permease protein LptF